MAKQTTRDAALSRLFGSASEDAPDAQESRTAHVAALQSESATGDYAPTKRSAPEKAPRKSEEVQGRGEDRSATQAQNVESGTTTQSGYIGLGRYSRSDGVVERITPYVRPDQAEALRIAVARKNDPRGTDVSQIIQSLLDEAGYSG